MTSNIRGVNGPEGQTVIIVPPDVKKLNEDNSSENESNDPCCGPLEWSVTGWTVGAIFSIVGLVLMLISIGSKHAKNSLPLLVWAIPLGIGGVLILVGIKCCIDTFDDSEKRRKKYTHVGDAQQETHPEQQYPLAPTNSHYIHPPAQSTAPLEVHHHPVAYADVQRH